jgi:D-sedoheptulose 7-phosphate isomerase
MINQLISWIASVSVNGGTIFVAGNGGSAANAEHFVNDLVGRKIKAVSLSSNMSLITMIANDYGYKYIFKKQLDVFATEDDLLILISCSGKSPNILEAAKSKVHQIKLFGGRGSYEDMETEHLNILHKVVEGLGKKCL